MVKVSIKKKKLKIKTQKEFKNQKLLYKINIKRCKNKIVKI